MSEYFNPEDFKPEETIKEATELWKRILTPFETTITAHTRDMMFGAIRAYELVKHTHPEQTDVLRTIASIVDGELRMLKGEYK